MNAVDQCLEQLRAGKPILVLDDENRQNEADLVMAAQFVTTQDAAYFLRHTSGFFCVAMPAERTRALGLPLMVGDPTNPLGTAFTVSVDAATGTSTGISAADRARTIRLLADRETATPISPGPATSCRCAPATAGSSLGPATPKQPSTCAPSPACPLSG